MGLLMQHSGFLKIIHRQYRKLKTNPEHKGGGFNKNKPYLFVLGCVMDRQIKAGKAWQIPKDIERYFKVNNFKQLQQISPSRIKKYFIEKKPHRFNDKMADCFNEAIKTIHTQYRDDASLIWKEVQSAATIICRFLEFRGVGLKIATMAVNLLDQENVFSEDFDRSAIDISPDRHVQRVMTRLGLVGEFPSVNQIIFKAKEIYPPFPGLLDLPFYDVGKKYCHARKPQCSKCPFYLYCEYGKNVKKSTST